MNATAAGCVLGLVLAGGLACRQGGPETATQEAGAAVPASPADTVAATGPGPTGVVETPDAKAPAPVPPEAVPVPEGYPEGFPYLPALSAATVAETKITRFTLWYEGSPAMLCARYHEAIGAAGWALPVLDGPLTDSNGNCSFESVKDGRRVYVQTSRARGSSSSIDVIVPR